jgi:hypothetical protein
VTRFARIGAFALIAIATAHSATQTAAAGDCTPCTSFALCKAPLTKSYKIEPGFCPQQLACLIPQCVSSEGCVDCCGPYGIPPVYVAGSYVLVRQTPEAHERVAKFLADLGAYKPPKTIQ